MTSSSMANTSTKLHVIDNLTAKEESIAKKMMEKNGYQFSKSPIFSESSHTMVITKNNGDAHEAASIQVELLKKETTQVVPHSIFQIKLETKSVEEVLEKLPDLNALDITPVALQN